MAMSTVDVSSSFAVQVRSRWPPLSHSLSQLPSLKTLSCDFTSSFQQNAKENLRRKGPSVIRGLARWEARHGLSSQNDVAFQISPISGVPLIHRKRPDFRLFPSKSTFKLPEKPRLVSKISLHSTPSPSLSMCKPPPVCTCAQRHFTQIDLGVRSQSSVSSLNVAGLTALYRNGKGVQTLAVAVVLDGVVAEVGKEYLCDTSPKSVDLRCNAVAALRLLQQRFQLILISFQSIKKTYRLLSYFCAHNLYFQATYTLPKSVPHDIVDYSPVLTDFGLSESQLLVISGLNIAYSDLIPSEKVLYSKTGFKIRLNSIGLPINPIPSILIPTIKSQETPEIVPFDSINDAIFTLEQGETWAKSVFSPDLAVITTNILHEVALDRVLPHPTAGYIRKFSEKCRFHNCPKGGFRGNKGENTVILHVSQEKLRRVDRIEVRPVKVNTGYLNLLQYVMDSK